MGNPNLKSIEVDLNAEWLYYDGLKWFQLVEFQNIMFMVIVYLSKDENNDVYIKQKPWAINRVWWN